MGRMNKYYQEVVLEDQDYLMDGVDGGGDDKPSKPKKVSKVVAEAGKKLGIDGLKLAQFVRWETGEEGE